MSGNNSPITGSDKPGLKAFLNPGWVIAAVLVVGFTYLAIAVLAPWQLGKNSDTNERNEQLDAAFAVQPVDFAELADDSGRIDPSDEWHRAILRGHYVPEHEVLLRMRPVGGGPAFNALTPFELDSGEIVLVNRGYVPARNTEVPPIAPAPSGEVTLTTHVRVDEPTPTQAPMNDQGYEQVWGINTEQISELTGLPLAHDFVQLTADQPGVLTAQPLPAKESGPYLSYGLQWIAFGIMAPLALGYFVFAELRERRRDEEDMAQASALDPLSQPQPYLSETPTEAPPKRARYGEKRNSAFHRRAERDEERF
ncbi:SURF1 family protein [Corynebacterium ciconiae DSM 44920]|uniref:SURF1 family cytochrome oxidase biogenesis protein n=1 Tax=Corynebacterium ciconiae TaxID=227319 RepID=UPI00036B920C|nr:SURF1 family protein [Corynebacterium ciconiae]WKD60703.1 SURF1 family protein [Corynebacterium ciconiae DSM 44920]